MKAQFHLHAVGRGADYQSIWWGRWRLWNQPADWQKHSGWLHFTLFQHQHSEQLSAICCQFKLVCPLPQVSMLAVDDMYQKLAPIVKDKHWAQRHFSVNYTLSTAAEILRPAFKGSTFDMRWSSCTFCVSVPFNSCADQWNDNRCKDLSLKCLGHLQDEHRGPWDSPA